MNRKARVGTIAWEKQGGPPLTPYQKAELLLGYSSILTANLMKRFWLLLRQGFSLDDKSTPGRIGLESWVPPDSQVAREAEAYLREVSSVAMVNHSYRTYYFAALLFQLSREKVRIDREALYVASLLHDVGLFQATKPSTEHCFTVGSAREARRIAQQAGWENARIDNIAVAIMTNLNPWVSMQAFGPEAHFMSAGGQMEVLAQYWKLHPDDSRQVLALYPRDDFASDSIRHVHKEASQNPGSRFGCLCQLYTFFIPKLAFKER
jgi:hypothetical protein